MSDFIIESKALTKQYGKTIALDHVNIAVQRGTIYGLVGKNGAGKTTLMRMITGQSIPTSGEVSLFGKTTEVEKNEVRHKLGCIIEEPSFYSKMTVEQNLEYYRIQRGVPGKERINELLEQVDLLDARKKKFQQLSLGMKQRLGIALALLHKPELLVLDEPINGLDPMGIISVRNLLIRLAEEQKVTILISSHILSELSNLVTEYGFMDQGRLVEQISSEELKEKCRSYLDIKVDDPKKASVILEGLQIQDYKVMPDQTIQIYDGNHESNQISEALITNHVALYEMTRKEQNLEQYYVGLIGGMKHE